MGSIPILNAGYTQWVVSAFTMHNQAVPPVPPAPTPLPNIPGLIEGPVPLGWPPGFILHAKGTKTNADGAPTVQYQHDCGYLIPHFAIPLNALCALHSVFSKHKSMWPVSTVLVEGTPAGSYMFFLLGLICANPVSMPTGVVILGKCTVWTGFKWADLGVCLAGCALEAAFDFVWGKITGGGVSPFKAPGAMQVLGGLTFREMVMWGGKGLVGRYMLRELGNQAIDHVLKSWVVGPLVSNLPRGSSGLGTGRASVKFFDAGWW
jgi:hypothetical protein